MSEKMITVQLKIPEPLQNKIKIKKALTGKSNIPDTIISILSDALKGLK